MSNATTVTLDVSEGIATITLNSPQTLNSLTSADYDAFAEALRAVDKRDDVFVTIWQAQGKWFSTGTDITRIAANNTLKTVRDYFTDTLAKVNTDVSHALYTHSKVLVAALNGPALGIVAAYLGHFDFIYALPGAWLSLPFSFLGIAAEGGSSVTFRNRMGPAKANEMLLWGRKKDAKELLEIGFINQIFPDQPVPSFHAAVRKHVLAELDSLVPSGVLVVKKLIKEGLMDQHNFHSVNLRESYAGAAQFELGIPVERFKKIARKELKHKL